MYGLCFLQLVSFVLIFAVLKKSLANQDIIEAYIKTLPNRREVIARIKQYKEEKKQEKDRQKLEQEIEKINSGVIDFKSAMDYFHKVTDGKK